MKKLMMTMAVALMVSVSAMAQNNESGERRPKFDKAEMAKHQTERMVKEYGLDEGQSAKLLELNTKYAGKLQMGGPRGPRGPRGGQGRDGQKRDGQKRDGQQQEKKVDGTTGATAKADAMAKPDSTDQNGGAQAEKRERPSREQMDARMKAMKAQQEAYNAELKEILTEEQYAKYEADMKKRMERRPHGHR